VPFGCLPPSSVNAGVRYHEQRDATESISSPGCDRARRPNSIASVPTRLAPSSPTGRRCHRLMRVPLARTFISCQCVKSAPARALLILAEVCGRQWAARNSRMHGDSKASPPTSQAIAKGLGVGLPADRRPCSSGAIIETIGNGSAFQHGHTYLPTPRLRGGLLEVPRIIATSSARRVRDLVRISAVGISPPFSAIILMSCDIRGRGLFQAIELVRRSRHPRSRSITLRLNQRSSPPRSRAVSPFPRPRYGGRPSRRHVLSRRPISSTA